MDNNYVLTIKVEDIEGTGSVAKGDNERPQQDISKPTNNMQKAVKLVTFGLARNLVLNKVGTLTRDSLLQQKINVAADVGQTAIAFYVNPVLGVANAVLSVTSQLMDYSINMNKETNRLGVMRERAGYINRSR